MNLAQDIDASPAGSRRCPFAAKADPTVPNSIVGAALAANAEHRRRVYGTAVVLEELIINVFSGLNLSSTHLIAPLLLILYFRGVPTGFQAAEDDLATLRPYALDEEAYAAHVAARVLPYGEDPVIEFVRFEKVRINGCVALEAQSSLQPQNQ
jgi:hypothetical protein